MRRIAQRNVKFPAPTSDAWRTHHYVCACGKRDVLHYNGGKMDMNFCPCGRTHSLEIKRVDHMVEEPPKVRRK
jgi:hypothetical protein